MALALFALLIAMLSIQTGAGIAKSLFPVAGVAGATSLRLLSAAVILGLIWKPWRHRFERKSLGVVFVYGASLGLMNLSFYFSLARIPLGIAVSLEFIGPLGLAIMTSRKPIDFLWALLAAGGIYFIMPPSTASTSLDPLGIILALAAGFFWAFYIYFGQKAGKTLPSGTAASAGMFFAALVGAPLGLFLEGDRLFNLSVLPLGLAVGALSSALPYSLEMFAMKKIPTKTFGILMSFEPALASLVGLLVLREFLLPTQWIAIFLIILASFGTTFASDSSRES